MIDPAALPAFEAPAADAATWTFYDEAALGTRLNVQITADRGDLALNAARAARAEIDRLNTVFNSRMAGSELVALNSSSEFTASPELFAAIAEAEAWRVATNGAFSPRLGYVLNAWRAISGEPPSPAILTDLASSARVANVELVAATRTIIRPRDVAFALDGFAKGWIVDAALKAARAAPGVIGALVDIGGDIATGGKAPANGWMIGIPDPMLPFDNAPLVTSASLESGAIATSGRGPRDRIIGGQRFSPTLSPFTGWPVEHTISASIIAGSAATAEALATAGLVLPHGDMPDLIARTPNAGARLTLRDGSSFTTGLWNGREQPEPLRIQSPGAWPAGWQALATFTAPRRQLIRDPDFRSPYVAMWITDQKNKPVRTLILVGKRAEWQKDNYIWWQQNRDATGRLMSTRSMSTSGSGTYNVFWDGIDDLGKRVQAGTYILHVETSRERGKHTYRQLAMDFSTARRFAQELAPTEEGGGIKVTYDHY
ncbi:MAG: DUF2271 domain-containing protein [Burkholderiales bacterium]|nr:MAG: DUF2271 domain-containing protein [Burkholderiales bacterium]